MLDGPGAGWQRAALTKGAVAVANHDAAAVAVEMFEAGGNAIDAAVAAAFAMGTLEPLDSGLGAGGFMVIHHAASGSTHAIDFMGTAPAAARYELYAATGPDGVYGIHVRGKANQYGHTSVATPGAVRGLTDGHARFGRLPLADLLAPSIRLAEQGFQVSHKAALRMARTEWMLSLTPETARVLLKPDGSLRVSGDIMANPDYAASLRTLVEEGPDSFYEGSLAETIAADMAANGGFLTADDLRGYRAVWRRPAEGRFRDLTFRTMSPPSGGALVIAGLRALAADPETGTDRAAAMARAMLSMFRHRASVMSDPGFNPVDLGQILGRGESTETTSLSTVDAMGNAVSITYSNNNHSGVVVPGTGILLNNQMLLFSPWPDNPNQVLGGKRPVSSMMPSIAFRDGKVSLAIGASGSTRIPTAILQVLYHRVVRGLPLEEAVTEPRLHAENEMIAVDEDIADVGARLAEVFGLSRHVVAGRDPWMASVQSIAVDGDGTATAVGDPRARAAGRVV